MPDFCTNLNSFFVNVIAAIFFAGLVYCANRLRYWWYLGKNFDDVDFDVFFKGDEARVVRTVHCTVEGNVIRYSGEHITEGSGQGNFEGEFIMNPLRLRIGEGLHIHSGYDGFNFPKLLIKDNDTFYIETEYSSLVRDHDKKEEYFERHSQSYIWRRKKEA